MLIVRIQAAHKLNILQTLIRKPPNFTRRKLKKKWKSLNRKKKDENIKKGIAKKK